MRMAEAEHPFVVSDAACDFRTTEFLNWLVFGHTARLPDLTGETGSIAALVSLELTSFEDAPHRGVGFAYELEATAEPVLRASHNTIGTAFTQFSFLRLDDELDFDRRLLLDVENPGGVEFELGVEWRATGLVAGNRPVYSAAAAELKLLRCGQPWHAGTWMPLFSEMAATAPGFPPVTEDGFHVTGSDAFGSMADARVQLWIGFDAQLQATSIRGDEEGTVGYGADEGSEAVGSGALVVRVEPP